MTQIRMLSFRLPSPASCDAISPTPLFFQIPACYSNKGGMIRQRAPAHESTAPPFPCSQASNHTHPQKSNQGAIQPSLPLPSVLPAYGPA